MTNDKPEAKATPPESKPEAPAEGEKKTPLKPEAVAKAEVKAETRAEWMQLRNKIETEKKEKMARQEALKKEAAALRHAESWIGNAPDEGIQASIAKWIISSTVDEKFQEYLPRFQENGLGDEDNMKVLKQAANDIIYDHFLKTGNSKETTQNYVKNVLGEKLKFLLEELDKLYKSKQYPFNKQVECLNAFSAFTGLNFIRKGFLLTANLKHTLLLEKSDYAALIKGFEEYLKLGKDINLLTGQSKDLESKNAPMAAVTAPSAAPTAAPAEALATTPAASPEKPAETKPGQPTEKTEEQEVEEAKKEAQAQLAAAESASAETATTAGGGFFEKLFSFFEKWFSKIMVSFTPLLAKYGMKEAAEFIALTDEEKTKGAELKETCKKMGLNPDTLHKLFIDAGETRKVLKAHSDSNLSWDDYLSKHLGAPEQEELKKQQDLPAEKIAQMFLTPVEETPQPPAAQPAPAAAGQPQKPAAQAQNPPPQAAQPPQAPQSPQPANPPAGQQPKPTA